MGVRFRRSPIRWGLFPLVVAGGAVGVAVRELLTFGLGQPLSAAPAIAGINVVGSGLLGVLVGWAGDRPRLRAFLGAGVLGGFTSYSALAPLLAFAVLSPLASADGPSLVLLAVTLAGGMAALVAVPLVVAALGFSAGARLARRGGTCR